ncbi:hypothetical protein AAMO2058_001281900 [Amorphochlora amoebiformis]|eukprot:106398-Amorphochlora_amoeboformis.AAC.1
MGRKLTRSRVAFFAAIVPLVYLSVRGWKVENVGDPGRKLLESELDNYPADAFNDAQLSGGAIVLHTMGFFYMFAALAIVCDEFFVPALEVISERLNLQDDVAGATFMAAGGSAPELATSFIGTFVSKSNVGFGTIVGSAVFNILFVIGACALFALDELELSWFPLARDSIYYAISLVTLIVFFMDKEIEAWEAGIQFSLYIIYVILMSNNRKLEKLTRFVLGLQSTIEDDINVEKNQQPISMEMSNRQASLNNQGDTIQVLRQTPADLKSVAERQSTGMKIHPALGQRNSKSPRFHFGLHQFFESQRLPHLGHQASSDHLPPRARWRKGVNSVIRMNRGKRSVMKMSNDKPSMSDVVLAALAAPYLDYAPVGEIDKKKFDNGNNSDDEVDGPMDLTWPSSFNKRLAYICLAPLTFPLYYTVPDVRREVDRWKYPFSFLMCVFWIAFYSYLMVWWATTVGLTLGIPSEIMGLTILAIGTSVPDLLESIIVTRDGKGDMAISSSIGSNIFDVTVGLPLPWLLYTIINTTSIEVGTSGLLISVVLLFGMLVCCILAIAVNKWRMTKTLGWGFLVLWLVFVGISLIVTLI